MCCTVHEGHKRPKRVQRVSKTGSEGRQLLYGGVHGRMRPQRPSGGGRRMTKSIIELLTSHGRPKYDRTNSKIRISRPGIRIVSLRNVNVVFSPAQADVQDYALPEYVKARKCASPTPVRLPPGVGGRGNARTGPECQSVTQSVNVAVKRHFCNFFTFSAGLLQELLAAIKTRNIMRQTSVLVTLSVAKVAMGL
eukprot:1183136-Prorocentrum_minimum.AAC.2